MLEEVESIKDKLDVSQTETSGDREYTFGKLRGTETVLGIFTFGQSCCIFHRNYAHYQIQS